MMKVVVDGIIYQLQAHGGISRIFSEILPRLCEIDESLHITLLTSGPCRQALPAHAHIQHSPIPRVERLLRPSRLWNPVVPLAKELVWQLYVGSGRGRIWHSTYYTMPYQGNRISWGGASVTTVVDMIHERFHEYLHKDNPVAFSEQKRRCIEQADRVIAISHSTRSDIIEYFGIPENKITVIHLAASTFFKESPETHNNELRKRFGLGKPFILYVGKRGGYKNFQILLKAYSLWKSRSDFELICVGGERKWSDNESEVITDSDLGNSVRLFDDVRDEELRRFYSSAYVFVYPSLYEGFGIPSLEAMACGTPVIASNASSMPEVIGDAGLYFEPSSREELLEALNSIADDGNLRRELIRRGLERSRMFSWEKTAAETYNVYKDIL